MLYPTAGVTPIPCSVRLWLRVDRNVVGDIAERHVSAEMAQSEDRVRFRISETGKLLRNAVLSVEVDEAYRIEFLYQIDDEFQTARVVRLSQDELAPLNLAVPA